MKADFRVDRRDESSDPRGARREPAALGFVLPAEHFPDRDPAACAKRKEDIPPLVAQFLRQFSQQLGKPEPDISPDAFQKLLDYSWPGNVRELQNAIEYAVVLARQGVIGGEGIAD